VSLEPWVTAMGDSKNTNLMQQDEKARFSQADYKRQNDYVLRFSDRQRLQELRRKLLQALRLLSSSIHFGEIVRQLCHVTELIRLEGLREVLLHELDDYHSEATHHHGVMQDLLQRATDTCELVY
jgi:thiamine biosynthesis protein ThiC